MTRPITKLATAALAGVLIASPLLAKGPGGYGPMTMTFEELDANGDGQVSLQEFQDARQARFASADADGDGNLTRDEMIAAIQARAGDQADRMIQRLDANGDGALSLDEMPKPRGDRMMKRLDRNDDGTLSREEFEAMKMRQDKKK